MALMTFLHWIMKDSGLWKVNTKWDEPYNCLVLLPGGVQITEGDGEGEGTDSYTVQWSHWVAWKELGVRGTNIARVHRAKYWKGRVVGIEHSAMLFPKAFCLLDPFFSFSVPYLLQKNKLNPKRKRLKIMKFN